MSYQDKAKIPLQDDVKMSYQNDTEIFYQNSEKLSNQNSADIAYQHNVPMGHVGEAVIFQPQGTAGSQPEALNKWSTDIFDCLDDTEVCLCGTFCPCIHVCMLANTVGECFCTPYVPGAFTAMRTSLRHRYNIKGTIATDSLVTFCFFNCALCQMARELKLRH